MCTYLDSTLESDISAPYMMATEGATQNGIANAAYLTQMGTQYE